MKKLLKIAGIVVLAAVVVLGGGILLAENGIDNPVSDATEKATIGAANAALDASGVKGQIDAALRDNIDGIAKETGLPAPMVEKMVDDLDVQSWKVATLPADAVATGSTDVEYAGQSATIVTYGDPGFVTVSTGAGDVTLEVPPDARGYVHYLEYLP